MSTRSAKLAAVHLSTTGWSTVYRAPLDQVVLLKTIAITSWAPSTGQVVMQLTAGPSPAQVRLHNATMANSEFVLLETWLVLEAGDEVAAFLGVAPVDVQLSGAVLPIRPE